MPIEHFCCPLPFLQQLHPPANRKQPSAFQILWNLICHCHWIFSGKTCSNYVGPNAKCILKHSSTSNCFDGKVSDFEVPDLALKNRTKLLFCSSLFYDFAQNGSYLQRINMILTKDQCSVFQIELLWAKDLAKNVLDTFTESLDN